MVEKTRMITKVVIQVGNNDCVVTAPDCRRSRGRWFDSTSGRFEAWAVMFTPLCLYLFERKIKALFLLYMPVEVNGIWKSHTSEDKPFLWN